MGHRVRVRSRVGVRARVRATSLAALIKRKNYQNKLRIYVVVMTWSSSIVE